ncbi:MAG: MarR family transcriptional regulator [Firmicutes bacterium]|jgi:DNA-binding MarR family transcriptional regulator|nr:MarR family transcriptional regulator [Bacillota bacterium]
MKHFGRIFSRILINQKKILSNSFKEYGIGSGQYAFYLTIRGNEGINQKEISKILNVNKGTTNKAIKKLEDLGYVDTLIDENDKRNHRLYLTEEGKKILPEIRIKLRMYSEGIVEGFTEEETELFFSFLERAYGNSLNMLEKI